MATVVQEKKSGNGAASDAQRRVIEAYRALSEQNGWTLTEASRPLQIASSTLSQVFSYTYGGNLGRICSRMSRVLHREKRRRSAPGRPRFKMTSVAQEVLIALQDAHALRLPVLITGPSGCGRSFTIAEYGRREPETIIVNAGPYARPKALLEQVAEVIGMETGGGVHHLRSKVAQALQGTDRLLVIDEIDYVPESTLQTLRLIADEAQCGIVYCGTRAFLAGLRRKRSATLGQFLNRVAFCLDCQQLTEADLDLLMEDVPMSDDCRELARGAAGGCARRLVNGVLLARRMAGDKDITAAVIKRAFRKLLTA